MAFDDSKGPFDQDYTCSFCGKKQSQVKKLIAQETCGRKDYRSPEAEGN